MRIIACEDVSTPPADPAGCYALFSNYLNSNLLRKLAAENVKLYRTVFINGEIVENSVKKGEIVENSVHKWRDCAEVFINGEIVQNSIHKL
jgi:hypothetical protein